MGRPLRKLLQSAGQCGTEEENEYIYSYDGDTSTIGRLTLVEGPRFIKRIDYNALGKRTSVRLEDSYSGDELAVHRTFSPQGRITQMTLPSGRTATYRYGPNGRVEHLLIGDDVDLNFTFRADGSPETVWGSIQHADGATLLDQTRAYDTRHRLMGIETSYGVMPGWGVRYAYNERNLITEYSDNLRGLFLQYDYDGARRLLSATGHEEGDYSYTYHRNSAINTVTLNGNVTTYSYASSKNARLSSMSNPDDTASYSYDDAGRQCGVRHSNEERNISYRWLMGGKIGAYETVGSRGQLWYDEVGKPIIKVVNGNVKTMYLGKVVEQTEGTLVERVHLGSMVLRFKEGEDVSLSFSDGRSNVLVVNAEGEVLETKTFRPYGSRARPGQELPDSVTSFGFQHKREDMVPGLVMFKARFYDPAARIFISPDPLRSGGVADVFESGKLQPYVFGAASPISFVDVDGLKPVIGSSCRSVKIRGEYGHVAVKKALRVVRRFLRSKKVRSNVRLHAMRGLLYRDLRRLMTRTKRTLICCIQAPGRGDEKDLRRAHGYTLERDRKRANGRQITIIAGRLNLDRDVSLAGAIAHEFAHSVGWWHPKEDSEKVLIQPGGEPDLRNQSARWFQENLNKAVGKFDPSVGEGAKETSGPTGSKEAPSSTTGSEEPDVR
ncbi:MAG: hypothetical protein KAI47_06300 [Deltaproteobacteria bacterium]|nr:hypothetical protein [Deltaproteobacteria bacterium]